MMEGMGNYDIRLYRKLMGQVNTFLSVKDSIRTAKTDEEMPKAYMLKCTEENKWEIKEGNI